MYECAICQTLNHASRIHCSCCGTIPPQYSLLRLPAKLVQHKDWTQFVQVIPAYGCVRAAQHHSAPRNPRTVPLEYYAE